jgi:hypothetical protein
MKSRFAVIALVLLEGSLCAQHLDFGFGAGVKGGFPVTDLLSAANSISLSSEDNYIVGPVAEVRLPFGFAIEGDGLYRGTNYHLTNAGGVPIAISSSSWELPYLGKFRFPIPLLKPFIVAGGAYRMFNDLPSNITPTHNGFVGGAGLELRIHRLRLSAEGRYLHWGDSSASTVRLSKNQGEILFGLIF